MENMELMEIMDNDDVEATEEIVETETNIGVKIGIGLGLAALAGAMAYKFGKPVADKIKAKIEQRKAKNEVIDIAEEDIHVPDEDQESEI